MKLSDLQKAKEALAKAEVPSSTIYVTYDGWYEGINPRSLGNCTTASTPYDHLYNNVYDFVGMTYGSISEQEKEQGNNPMAYNTASATTVTYPSKSDEMIQRDYLLDQLRSSYETWRDPSVAKLRKLFNMDGPTRPIKTLDLIDAIKNGKYTLDDKLLKKMDALQAEYDEDGEGYDAYTGYSSFYGVIFTDFPQPDEKGFNAARVEWSEALKNAKNKIMILPPTEGLDILTALADWVPTGKAN